MKKIVRLKDEIYKNYKRQTNMSFSTLIKFKSNPLSTKTKQDRSPINLTLRLKKKKRSDWKLKDYKDSIKAISNIKRLKGLKSKKVIPGTKIKYKDVALMNWGHSKKLRS